MKKYANYLILIIFTMGTQAFFYYLTKSFPTDFHILNSIIDVPLVKPFIYFYSSWYPFIIINTFLIYLHDKNLFKYLIIAMLLSAFMSHLTFIIYPSEVIRPTIEVKNFTDWLIDFTYKGDNPAVNCLPSMHAVYCFVTSFFIFKCKNLKFKFFIIFYSFLIVLSTVFIKQHVIEDILLALIYSIIAILIVYLNKNRILILFDKLNNIKKQT